MSHRIEHMGSLTEFGARVPDPTIGMVTIGGNLTPVPPLPHPIEGDAAERHAYMALAACARHVSERAKITDNRELSPEGQERRLIPMDSDLVTRVGNLAERVTHEVMRVRNAESAFYAPPDPSGGNVVDVEIRGWLRGLTDAQRSALIPDLDKPDNHRITVAIINSPYEIPILSRHAREAWRKIRDAGEPDKALTLRRSSELATWAENAIIQAAWLTGKVAPAVSNQTARRMFTNDGRQLAYDVFVAATDRNRVPN